MSNHTWTEKDDLMILFVHKFGIENSPLTIQEIADKIGATRGSVNRRIANFKFIDGIGNASHVTRLSRAVHKKYSTLSELELKKLAFNND